MIIYIMNQLIIDGVIICSPNYDVFHIINHGSFGNVYFGINKYTQDEVAIKIDKTGIGIKNEAVVLQFLQTKKCKVVPPIVATGPGYLIIPYYQLSLAEYMQTRDISPEHAHEILANMLIVLKQVHSCGVVHRDIKPANFMLSGGYTSSMVLIDFGMAAFCIDSDRHHIECPTTKLTTLIGSPKYASINVHLGITPVRRDDVISCAYIYRHMICDEPNVINNDSSGDVAQLHHPVNLRNYEKKKLENIPNKLKPTFAYLYGLSFMECPDYDFILEIINK